MHSNCVRQLATINLVAAPARVHVSAGWVNTDVHQRTPPFLEASKSSRFDPFLAFVAIGA